MSDAVTVAVIDSGVNVPHPHLPAVSGGVGIDPEGRETDDYVDVLGHGTAVAAAIHEKAPAAQILAVKVFQRELATTARTLVRAIDWAAARGVRLVNLSLGTPLELRAAELEPVVERAVRAGTIVVSAFELDGHRWYPGSMDHVVGVCLDAEQPRELVAVAEREGRLVLRASPYPRPIPGVPRERNLNGISFAVANATGCLAAALAGHTHVRTAAAALALLRGSPA
ncbi:MAG TPA: S8 family serine peptidase [Longimicrobiales bacterium]|nr:S8 family serine peptidase [Longimicrobiales bacterium]